MRIALNNSVRIVETNDVRRESNVIYCHVNGAKIALGVYSGTRFPNNKTMTCEKIAQEVMISMGEFFDLFPNQLFYMPTQKEIEQRIIDGEDDE